jgi:hypothetical protein
MFQQKFSMLVSVIDIRSYLRGLQYNREKKKEKFHGNQHIDLVTEETSLTKKSTNTAKRLAEQHKVSERTI